jgi:hypothetical protein
MVQNASQAQGKDGRDAFAPLLARKIRERSIRPGIIHRLLEERTGTVSAHPGYGCRWGENGRDGTNGKTTEKSADPHAVVVWGGWSETGVVPVFLIRVCLANASECVSYIFL